VPSAKSTNRQATADADPLDEAAGDAPRRARVDRRTVEVVLAQKAERQLVGDRFAGAAGPCLQQLRDADGVQ
jgi:hypothetical protein